MARLCLRLMQPDQETLVIVILVFNFRPSRCDQLAAFCVFEEEEQPKNFCFEVGMHELILNITQISFTSASHMASSTKAWVRLTPSSMGNVGLGRQLPAQSPSIPGDPLIRGQDGPSAPERRSDAECQVKTPSERT